jgi:hypothetical protein
MKPMGIAALAVGMGLLISSCSATSATSTGVAAAAIQAATQAQDCPTIEVTQSMDGQHLDLIIQQPVVFLDIPNKDDYEVVVSEGNVLEVTEPEGSETFQATYGLFAANPGEAEAVVKNRTTGETFMTLTATVSALGFTLDNVSRDQVAAWPDANIFPGFKRLTLVRGQSARFDGPEATLASANPDVLSVQGESVEAQSPGQTTLEVDMGNGDVQTIDVYVIKPEGVNLYGLSQLDLMVNNQTPIEEAKQNLEAFGFTVEVVDNPDDLPPISGGDRIYLLNENGITTGGSVA